MLEMGERLKIGQDILRINLARSRLCRTLNLFNASSLKVSRDLGLGFPLLLDVCLAPAKRVRFTSLA